ncbi:hypothetical protein [Streptomyces umbrinus]|uniref:hypothetical protein n=1 Tax=Streptomyces umbrinus TaxID=67370 RepID=UPI003C2C4EFB
MPGGAGFWSPPRLVARLRLYRGEFDDGDVGRCARADGWAPRREFLHLLSTKLIFENQGIAVEDLSVAGLARTKLAKSVHGAGWSSCVSTLQY